jgi:hypothetical protein
MKIPIPEAGLVLNYSYLWYDEHLAGHEEGFKNRPSVVISSIKHQVDGKIIVTVLPITHSVPQAAYAAIEIPQVVKAHLGLDDERSWIVVSESNEFTWPGFDLRNIAKTDRCEYGFLPPRLFDKILIAFKNFNQTEQRKHSPRN